MATFSSKICYECDRGLVFIVIVKTLCNSDEYLRFFEKGNFTFAITTFVHKQINKINKKKEIKLAFGI